MVAEMSILTGEVVEFENTDLISIFQKTLISKSIKDSLAVIFESNTFYTFQELDDLSTSLADVIHHKSGKLSGVTKQISPVVVCLPPSEKIVAILFAILKSGGTYVPVDYCSLQSRVDEILVAMADFPTFLVITNSEFAHKFKNCKILQLKSIFEEAKKNQWHNNHLPPPSEFPAILYTSGSTGKPKGVLISNRTLVNRLTWQWAQFPFLPNEKCVLKTNLTFVDSMAEIFGPLLQGYSVTVLSKRTVLNSHLFVQKLHENSITRVTLVPSHLNGVLDTIELLGNEGFPFLQNIRLWISSGEVLRMATIEKFLKLFPDAQLCNFYGSTEVMGDVTFEIFTSFDTAVEKCVDYSVSIGRAIQNAEIQIWNKNNIMVNCGITGEIVVSGIHILNKEFPARNCKETFYKTGDVGFIKILSTGDKKLFYLGRKDKNVKIRGQKVNLCAVEEKILRLPYVTAVKVLLREYKAKDSELVAFVAGNNLLNSKQLRKQLLDSDSLKSHEIPQIFQIMSKLPMLPNGKIECQKLLASSALSKGKNLIFSNAAFKNISVQEYERAKKVVSILANVTGTSEQDIMDNTQGSFYEIGGNSLNMVTVVLEMNRNGIEIDLTTFIGALSIQQTIELVLSQNMRTSEMLVVEEPKFDREEIRREHLPFVKRLMSRICCTDTLSMKCPNLKYSFIARRQVDGILAGLSINTIITDTTLDVLVQQENSPYLLQFVHQAEAQAKTKLLGKGRILHNLNVEVCEDLEMGSEKVSVLLYLEKENILFARENKCCGVLTTNTSIVTQNKLPIKIVKLLYTFITILIPDINPISHRNWYQEICSALLQYETLCEIQAAAFITNDGTKPFLCSPPSDKIVCCFRSVDGNYL